MGKEIGLKNGRVAVKAFIFAASEQKKVGCLFNVGSRQALYVIRQLPEEEVRERYRTYYHDYLEGVPRGELTYWYECRLISPLSQKRPKR